MKSYGWSMTLLILKMWRQLKFLCTRIGSWLVLLQFCIITIYYCWLIGKIRLRKLYKSCHFESQFNLILRLHSKILTHSSIKPQIKSIFLILKLFYIHAVSFTSFFIVENLYSRVSTKQIGKCRERMSWFKSSPLH